MLAENQRKVPSNPPLWLCLRHHCLHTGRSRTRHRRGSYVIVDHLLHEPVVAGSLHGNALGFMDWFALITLLWVVGFGSHGLPRPLGEAGSEVDDAKVDDSEPSRADHLTLEYKEIS